MNKTLPIKYQTTKKISDMIVSINNLLNYNTLLKISAMNHGNIE